MKENNDLKNQVIKSSIWLFGGNIVSRIISLLSTLILAKLLTPVDFGVIGYGFLVVQTVGLFRDMGFNSALIYQKDNIEIAASTAFWFSTAWSFLLYLIIFLSAPLAAIFFREPKLVLLLRVLSISLIFSSISSVPLSLMEKDINFKKRIVPEVVNQSLYGIITVVLAFLDLKYWAFVYGTMIASFTQMIVSYIIYPVKIRFKFDISVLKEMFGFGKNVMGLGLIYFGIRNIDDFAVGRMLGTVQLGIYQFSYRIANIPATNISNVLGKVLYPGFMKIADSDWDLRNAFMKSFRYVAFITIPVTFYIILVIPDFINLFYPQWVNAIVPIQMIAYFGGLRAIGSGTGSVFYAKGKPDLLVPIAITQLIILTILLYPAIHFFGVTGACLSINISITYSFLHTFYLLKKIIGLRFYDLVISLKFPMLYSIFIFAILFCIENVYLINNYTILIIKLLMFPAFSILVSVLFSNTYRDIIKDFLLSK